jgi:hypothetical protein
MHVSMKSTKAVGRAALAAAGLTVAVGIVFGASSLASADNGSPSSTASASSNAGPRDGGSSSTAVTGDELTKVTAAMNAKDASITVSSVRKDPDGSYDVRGTKNGANVFYDVSADLNTITLNSGEGGNGHGRGGSPSTPVTGDELTKVTAAMNAKDASITVSSVRKDPDGSYDVRGTKDGANVFYDVSADLNTIKQNTDAPGW